MFDGPAASDTALAPTNLNLIDDYIVKWIFILFHVRKISSDNHSADLASESTEPRPAEVKAQNESNKRTHE